MNHISRILKSIFFFFFLCSLTANAQVRFARLFSDHAVLQRQKPLPVWGWAKPNEKIKITIGNQSLQTKTDKSGKWSVTFQPFEAGGPYQITATAKSGTATATDLLFGEVWLCSGQSNMEFKVSEAFHFDQEKKDADYPQIRHFKIAHEVTLEPVEELNNGEWILSSEKTVGDFTAVGFFFARELYQKLNVPIGLVNSSWGGSQIEGWISKEAMETNSELRNYAQSLPKTWEEADVIMGTKLRKRLFGKDFTPDVAFEKTYLTGKADFSPWQKTNNPVGQWDWKGLMGFRGQGYIGTNIEIDTKDVNVTSELYLPVNDSETEVYLNGKIIASGIEKGNRKINLPANTFHTGSNQLVVKSGNQVAQNWYGPGWMGSRNDLKLTINGNTNSLGNDWYLMPAFSQKHQFAHLMNNVGTTIYNAMIVPIIPFAMRGTLWYQGESNAGRAFQYRQSFPLMINDWRKLWQDNFSFYWVQLASFGAENNSTTGSDWAELREAQDMTLSLPNTGMAVTIDVGNPNDIHPKNKQDVAHRLATQALKKDYGLDIPYASPQYDQVKFENGKAIVTFKFAANGLEVRKDKYGYLKGFEIAGSDKVFHFAKAEIKDNQVLVYSNEVSSPVAVRYAWSNAPEEANLFSKDGFPASGFRTDNWPGVTDSRKFE